MNGYCRYYWSGQVDKGSWGMGPGLLSAHPEAGLSMVFRQFSPQGQTLRWSPVTEPRYTEKNTHWGLPYLTGCSGLTQKLKTWLKLKLRWLCEKNGSWRQSYSEERLKYFLEFKGDQKVSLEGAVTLEALPQGPHPMINSIWQEVNQSASRDFLFHGHPALC